MVKVPPLFRQAGAGNRSTGRKTYVWHAVMVRHRPGSAIADVEWHPCFLVMA